MSLDAYTILHRWFDEVWNQGREETIDELLATDGIAHGLSEGEADLRGPADFKIFLRTMRAAFPDVRIRVEDIVVQGDKGVVRIAFEGTHLGDDLGLPPTEKRVTVGGIILVRVANGQIAEAWNAWDQLALLKQVGAVPAPPLEVPDRFMTVR